MKITNKDGLSSTDLLGLLADKPDLTVVVRVPDIEPVETRIIEAFVDLNEGENGGVLWLHGTSRFEDAVMDGFTKHGPPEKGDIKITVGSGHIDLIGSSICTSRIKHSARVDGVMDLLLALHIENAIDARTTSVQRALEKVLAMAGK